MSAAAEATADTNSAAHPWLQRRILLPLVAVLVIINLPFLNVVLRGSPEVTQSVPFRDDFNHSSLGNDWWSNGGQWRIVNGELYSPGVGNNPLWLKARLPADARIEFDVRSEGANGDIKWEAWGDGRNHSTGYVFLFGAWANRENRICKLDEHALTEDGQRARLAQLKLPLRQRSPGLEGVIESIQQPFIAWSARRDLEKLQAGTYYTRDVPVVVTRLEPKVVKGQRYHMKIEKRGTHLRWEIDGQLMLELEDKSPLSGRGNDRFGFSSWQNDTY
ncbi:MAG: hypothetical protein JST92_24090, partial [Deltaproteobacteria bacterium]|nr:hypothetical protein [Deltaproteobacteria bacterium]